MVFPPNECIPKGGGDILISPSNIGSPLGSNRGDRPGWMKERILRLYVGWTRGRTDTASYRDALSHLKTTTTTTVAAAATTTLTALFC